MTGHARVGDSFARGERERFGGAPGGPIGFERALGDALAGELDIGGCGGQVGAGAGAHRRGAGQAVAGQGLAPGKGGGDHLHAATVTHAVGRLCDGEQAFIAKGEAGLAHDGKRRAQSGRACLRVDRSDAFKKEFGIVVDARVVFREHEHIIPAAEELRALGLGIRMIPPAHQRAGERDRHERDPHRFAGFCGLEHAFEIRTDVG